MTTDANNQTIPKEFTHRGLTFKIHRAEHLNFWTIKNGNSIVARYFSLPYRIEADILTVIQEIKDGVDAGFGLNIDYSKVK